MDLQLPDFEDILVADKDCEHFGFCNKLGITTDDCKAGAKTIRCSQGDFAQIKLLSRLLDTFCEIHKELKRSSR
jgi:hypothetical protein